MPHSYLGELIDREFKNKTSPQDYQKIEMAREVLRETLTKTAHVPVVTSVAIGAAHCSFKAKLIEAIGVIKDQYVFKDKIMGEGSNLHKILAIASLLYFNKGLSITQSIREAINDVKQHLTSRSGLNEERLTNDAVKLFETLIKNLQIFEKNLDVREGQLKPVVEQTLIDFDVHLRGIPDLILEDRKARKAVVVEWKTGGSDTPSNYERAQVIAYAILEARRLGYSIEELERVIIGTLDDTGRVKEYSILPVIIRATTKGELYPHPALAPQDKVKERFEEFKNLLRKILIEAEHLTVLLTHQKSLTGVNPDVLKIPLPNNPDIKVNILRYTPPILPRGTPKTQDSWPCVSKKKKPICEYIEPCKFYFGRFGEKEDYERILWGLRFEALNYREKMLSVYRGLHDFFKFYVFFKNFDVDKIIGELSDSDGSKCMGIIVDLARPYEEKISSKYGKRRLCKDIIILRDKQELFNGRVDIVEKIEIGEDGEIVYVKRRIAKYEKDSEHGFMPRVVREGSPILISLMDSWSPLLSTSIFGRVDNVRYIGDNIEYQIGFPSRLLELQKNLLKHYVERSLEGRFLMAEINVDLTKADLETIDALQRSLKSKSRELPTEEAKLHSMEDRVLEKQKRKLRSEYGDIDATFDSILRKVLSRKKG